MGPVDSGWGFWKIVKKRQKIAGRKLRKITEIEDNCEIAENCGYKLFPIYLSTTPWGGTKDQQLPRRVYVQNTSSLARPLNESQRKNFWQLIVQFCDYRNPPK